MDRPAKASILFVDDEPQILEGLALHLRRDYLVSTAASPQIALQMLKDTGAPEVLVSDMRMPGMDGAALLKIVKEEYPETTRILLTGETGRDAAMVAVNEGQIFRFLTKPCPPNLLRAAVDAGVEHHRVLTAEKRLLQETVVGCIEALVDVLAITNPAAFGRATRVKRLAVEVAAAVGMRGFWQLEAAAMLSQMGYVSLPVELMEKIHVDQRLTPEERALAEGAPGVAAKLLGRIPRLEPVLQVLAASRSAGNDLPEGLIKLGAGILRLVLDYDAHILRGSSVDHALDAIKANGARYDGKLVAALGAWASSESSVQQISVVMVSRVRLGMVILDDVRTALGALLIPKGFEVTQAFLERSRNFAPAILQGKVRVLAPPAADD